MALTTSIVEQLAEWRGRSEALADARARARSDFFGYDEPGTVNYLPGAEEVNGRERRFLGWFGFRFRLPDGQHPAELPAITILTGPQLAAALRSIQGTRYVMGVVTTVSGGRSIFLKLQNDEFEVESRVLPRVLRTGDTLCVHVLPIGRNRWLPAPGWVVWPVRFGPGIQRHLKKFQLDPVQVERFLQRRLTPPERRPKIEYPRDKTLEEAVARMTAAAQAEGKDRLVRPVEEWKTLVLACIKANNFNRFSKDVVKRVGEVPSLDDLNRWLALAMNIWNSTPQPDRGGRTAYELSREELLLDD